MEEELEEWDATAAANGFMLFKDWQHIVKNRRSYPFGNERDPDYEKRFDAIVEWRALRLYNTHRYPSYISRGGNNTSAMRLRFS